MAWTYSNWRSQATAADQLASLKLHIQEVADKLSAEVGAHGYSKSTNVLNDYLKRLEDRADTLSAAAGTVNGGVSLATFREPM